MSIARPHSETVHTPGGAIRADAYAGRTTETNAYGADPLVSRGLRSTKGMASLGGTNLIHRWNIIIIIIIIPLLAEQLSF